MTTKFLDIHLEGMDDNGEKLKRILDECIPVAISVCPETLREGGIYSKQYPYLPKFIDLIGSVVSREGSILGQQGNMHKCKYEHKFVDPWHENFCLYNKGLSEDEQRDLMEKGRETLIKLIGKTSEMYVPPNHLNDLNTLVVANDMGYDLFAIKGLITIECLSWFNENAKKAMIVLPETKINRWGKFKYIHYDKISEIGFDEVTKNASDYHMIPDYWPSESLSIINRNRKFTIRDKFLRDIIKFPSRLLK